MSKYFIFLIQIVCFIVSKMIILIVKGYNYFTSPCSKLNRDGVVINMMPVLRVFK